MIDVQSLVSDQLEAASVSIGSNNGISAKRASLNLCSGATSHELHRVGKFQKGQRRCLTAEEMLAKGFTMSIEPVKRCLEGNRYTEQMETWRQPVSDQQREWLASMSHKERIEE